MKLSHRTASRLLFIPLFVVLLVTNVFGKKNATQEREKTSFNQDWLFHLGDSPDARFPETDDRTWRKLDLPHDWAIESAFEEKNNARTGGLSVHGPAWYRKHFNLPKSSEDKIVTIEFDGAMNNSEVWINGHFLGKRPNGYIGFQYDLTKYILRGNEDNVISVKLCPEDVSSRWYPGAGIYRNVWLETKSPVHIAHWGTTVTTPEIDDAKAIVNVEAEVSNITDQDTTLIIVTDLIDPNGNIVSSTESNLDVRANSSTENIHTLKVEKPLRWDIDSPILYTARISLLEGEKSIDSHKTPFGIRSIEFNKDLGFLLNGEATKLKGVCLHHDLGPLGSAVNTRGIERQLEIMKSMGANAIRTAHNPPSPEKLELCDKLGLLVQVEAFDCWEIGKVANGYNKDFAEWHERDLRDMIRRDRNHPSVIMWSIGNEILEQTDNERGPELTRQLAAIVRQEDSTRPSTAGFNYFPDPIKNGLAHEIDIVGFNYHPASYEKVLEEHPDWIIYGSETASCVSTRGSYHLPIEKYEKHDSLEITSYDLIGPRWAYPPDIEFYFLEKNPQALGEFIWTGFDYLGEPTPYGGKDNHTHGQWNSDWPARSSYFGAVDLSGFPKDRYYLYQSHWTDEPMIHLLPHWNWENSDQTTIPVYSYTNCDQAELFLNGRSLGKRTKGSDTTDIEVDFYNHTPKSFKSKYRLNWEVPYEPGVLKVVGYIDGEIACEKEIRTASEPARITLIPDRDTIAADGKDLSFITVRIEDSEGTFVPEADNLVSFELEGPGSIAAVGNGNPATLEPFQSNQRKAFNGLCLLIIKSELNRAGEIKIHARSHGLKSADTILMTN